VTEDFHYLDGDAMGQSKASKIKGVTKRRGSTWLIILCGALALAVIAVTLAVLFLSHLADRQRPVKAGVELLKGKKAATATVLFQRGSNLTHLARAHYGQVNPTILDIILEANPSITDINRIPVHKTIVMPPLAVDSFILSIPDKPFAVHLGAYDHRPSLTVFQDAPALKGKTVEIVVRTISPKERWYRVMAGPFPTKEEAAAALKTMKQSGIPLELTY